MHWSMVHLDVACSGSVMPGSAKEAAAVHAKIQNQKVGQQGQDEDF
jgi:hypothetical protein